MKKSIAVLVACAAFSATISAAETSPLVTKWTPDSDTTIINHKKGWASVLTLKGDRGVGLTIEQGNKTARGIVMKSGSAKVTMSPSYVAAGVPNSALPHSSETAAVVFNVEGAKLDGANGTRIALDAKTKSIYWIDANGIVIGTLEAE